MGGLAKGVGGMVDNTLGTNMFGQNSNMLASQKQSDATAQANKFLGNTYTQQQNYLSPYANAGKTALGQIAGGNIMDGYKASDAYNFRLAEGQTGINNAMAARGLGNSGAALKALTKYQDGLMSQDQQQYYANEMGRLGLLAGYGNGAANQLSANAGAYGANVSNNMTGLGDAQAAAQIGMGNQTTGLVNNMFQLAGNGAKAAAGGGGAIASDIRVKKNIKPVSKEELESAKPILKAYAFNYLTDEYGDGDWIGVMAQDLEKTPWGKYLVYENEQGIKVIDQKKLLSLFLATMSEEAA